MAFQFKSLIEGEDHMMEGLLRILAFKSLSCKVRYFRLSIGMFVIMGGRFYI